MDTNWLQDFICFARVLNFTKAAEERNITQSAFSRRIKSLENWVGLELIDRKSFPANLSRAGEEFLPVAKLVIRELLRTRDELRLRETVDGETIRFAAPHSVSIYNLMPLLRELELKLPVIKTRVISDNLHDCCEQLAEENCDFLVCYRDNYQPITLDEQRFERLDIGRDKLLPVYAPTLGTERNDWNFNESSSKQGIPYLKFSRGSYLGAITERIIASNPVSLEVRHTDALAEALKRLCLKGAGVAWLPETSILDELANGYLVIAGDSRWHEPLNLSIYAEPSILTKYPMKVWQFFKTFDDAYRKVASNNLV